MKAINNILNLVLLAGTTLLLVLIVLSGSTHHYPFDDFYWIRGDTSAISGAPSVSAWTFWGVCDYNDFSDCRSGPAYPISPVDNFGTTTNVPHEFVTNRDTLFYLSRFAFAVTLVGLAFCGFAFIVDILGFCSIVIDKIVICLVAIALFFISAAAAFLTAAAVLARNAFSDAGLKAHIGAKNMGMIWAAEACILIVFFNTCAANIVNSYRKHINRVRAAEYPEETYYTQQETQQAGGVPIGDDSSFTRSTPVDKEETSSGGIRFFRIDRNKKVSDEDSV